jgi:diadenosine tetraphosphate (Ap4A) HIT family hydrolase
MEKLPIPPKEAIIYEDEQLYICLASFPITRAHTVIVWKNDVEDIHLLSRKEYTYLMDMVDIARNMLLEKLEVEKVYLMYMDEVKQVHWHLIPRYKESGFNVLQHAPIETHDFSIALDLKIGFCERIKNFI